MAGRNNCRNQEKTEGDNEENDEGSSVAEPIGYCSNGSTTMCQSDEHCANGFCIFPGECSDDSDYCTTPMYACTDDTAIPCSSTADCTSGGSCQPIFQCVNDTTQECDGSYSYCFDTQGSTDCPEGYTCGGDYSCCTAECEPTPFLEGDPFCGEGICESCFGECTDPADCDDSDACTVEDCVDNECQYSAVDCDDSNACTEDSCDSLTGCANNCNATGNQDPCCADPACSSEPICQAGYPQSANIVAASHGRTSLIGSGVFNSLALLLIPIGGIIFLRILRRTR